MFYLNPDASIADRNEFFRKFASEQYSNSEPVQSLFYDTAQQTLNDRGLMRQLRREDRHDRRAFRREARERYRNDRDAYRQEMEAYEEKMRKHPNNHYNPPVEPTRDRYDMLKDAGKARRLGGRSYRDAYLAYRQARNAVKDALIDNGMVHNPNAGLKDDPQTFRGTVEYIGAGQDFLDRNRDAIMSGDAYFKARADKEAERQAELDLEAKQSQYDQDRTKWLIDQQQRMVGKSANPFDFSHVDDYTDDLLAEYDATHTRPTEPEKTIPGRYKFTGYDPEGSSTDSNARIKELYGPNTDIRYIAAMMQDPDDYHGVFDKETGKLRPYTDQELYDKYSPWVRENLMEDDLWIHTPYGYRHRDDELHPKAQPSHIPYYLSEPSALVEAKKLFQQNNGNQLSRGGRLRVPKRNSYGDRVSRADNLGTDEYDVYF